jgi:hypothetical protein
MYKLTFSAIVWTLILAIPFTVIALVSLAYLTEHAVEFANFSQAINQQTTIGGRGWLTEMAERLPELAGMLIGQLVILTILLFSRKMEQTQNT